MAKVGKQTFKIDKRSRGEKAFHTPQSCEKCGFVYNTKSCVACEWKERDSERT